MNTSYWVFTNLIVPLLTIPIVMGIQWACSRPTSWQSVIEDGQVCFYGATVLAAAWYELSEVAATRPVTGTQGWVAPVGAIATLSYGVLASDHLAAGW